MAVPDDGAAVTYGTAHTFRPAVLAHKLREAMASSVKGLQIGDEGRVAEATAPISAAMSGRRTELPTGSTDGAPRTDRANAGPWW